jgi:hypothetical protein
MPRDIPAATMPTGAAPAAFLQDGTDYTDVTVRLQATQHVYDARFFYVRIRVQKQHILSALTEPAGNSQVVATPESEVNFAR